jgi:hypothetical protein
MDQKLDALASAPATALAIAGTLGEGATAALLDPLAMGLACVVQLMQARRSITLHVFAA